MKSIKVYKDKHVLVLGLAKSGHAAAKLLTKLGAKVTVNDRAELDTNKHALELKELGVEIVGGGHPENLVHKDLDLLVKNPGIPYQNILIKKALANGVPVITEVELAYQVSDAPFIAVTGSNGKTTTTMLTGELLSDCGKTPITAGNIGTVLCEVAQIANDDNVIVSELSSFQLMGIRTFKPRVAVFLNLYEAHLDYHGTMEAYGRAKARMTENQTDDDFIIYNADQPLLQQFLDKSKSTRIPFSASGAVTSGAYQRDGILYFKDEKIMAAHQMAAPGTHNVENALAAIAVAKIYGVTNTDICERLSKFSGVKHRLQYVIDVSRRKFFNDSKATNVLATSKALQAFEEPVILLAGGLDRGNAFDELIPQMKHVKAVLCFGETKKKIAEMAKKAGVKTVKLVDNVEDAVPEAYALSAEGDVVLLSPACASWDQYRSFEERGDMFINSVHNL